MTIGIDVSQLAYPNVGVSNYLENLVRELTNRKQNKYILFFSSLRGKFPHDFEKDMLKHDNVKIKKAKLPQTLLTLLWNNLHKFPIEKFVGEIDIFITSDWTEPPSAKSKKATIIYDLISLKYPEETEQKIVSTQKRKLHWVKKESDIIFCISESTKKDVIELLEVSPSMVKVVYPGL